MPENKEKPSAFKQYFREHPKVIGTLDRVIFGGVCLCCVAGVVSFLLRLPLYVTVIFFLFMFFFISKLDLPKKMKDPCYLNGHDWGICTCNTCSAEKPEGHDWADGKCICCGGFECKVTGEHTKDAEEEEDYKVERWRCTLCGTTEERRCP